MIWFRGLLLVVVAVGLSGCFDSGSSSGGGTPDVGDNNIDVVVAIGDSITEGRCVPAGAPYPSRVGGLSGKNVVNQGICGERSAGGASRMGGVLNRFKPGYVVIFYGANDAIFGMGSEQLINNLRNMISAAQANQTVPLLCTLLPMYDSHAFANPKVDEYNPLIRELAKEMKVKLIDLSKEYGANRSFLLPDGLHPSDSGNQLIALAINDKIR
jgi:lysophospholipase L1-like esterase